MRFIKMRIKKFYENWYENEEDEEEVEFEELEKRYRDDLEGYSTEGLIEIIGIESIYNYVDDDRFIEMYVEWEVERIYNDSSLYTDTFTTQEMQDFLKEEESSDNLKELREWKEKKLREEFEDDEEYEWEVEALMNDTHDDIIDEIDDKDELKELLELYGIIESSAQTHYENMYRNSTVKSLVSEFCSSGDIPCILGWIKNYINKDSIIDSLVNDADEYWLREVYG